MERSIRHPRDVIGDDPVLMGYWNEIPPRVRVQLLESRISVSTLGELKKLAEELNLDTTVPPS